MYEQLAPAASAPPVEEEEEEPEEVATDFNKEIAKEVTGLKDRKKQRFKMYDTGLRNCMFIEMRVDKGQPGPCEVRAVLCRMCSWSDVSALVHCKLETSSITVLRPALLSTSSTLLIAKVKNVLH